MLAYARPLASGPTRMEALWPPKPKLLLIAACSLRSRGCVRRVVQIALRIGRVEIDRRRASRCRAAPAREHQLHAAAGAQQVAELALGAGDADFAGVLAEDAS